jgi:hypothetical protein
MTYKSSTDEIMKWYYIIEDFKKSNLNRHEYCAKNNFNYTEFMGRYRRIIYRRISNPEEYNAMIPIAKEYLKYGVSPSVLAKENNVSVMILKDYATHLRYLEVIERELKNKGKTIEFHEISTVEMKQNFSNVINNKIEINQEIIHPKNDIEITIIKGVKVIISPELGDEKLIKIINLLKDL